MAQRRRTWHSLSIRGRDLRDTDDDTTNSRDEMIRSLFGLSDEAISVWPGLYAVCDQMEESFRELVAGGDALDLGVINRLVPGSRDNCWQFCRAVIGAVGELQEGEASLEKIYQMLPNRQLSFSAQVGTVERSSQGGRRPVAKMFRDFRLQPQSREADATSHYGPEDQNVLYESSLNYFTLHKIGHVRIEWVNTLIDHLRFDRITKELFPVPGDVFADSPRDDPATVYREVLLSYRLLFGQSSRSRDLARGLLAEAGKKGQDDPFLYAICTANLSRSVWQRFCKFGTRSSSLPPSIFPPYILDVDGSILESDTYSARHDFPVFGNRLLVLQRYSLRQQPSRVRDLWRDRRNPLQWYTFWAVLWVGGLSLILSAVQVGLAAGQLYYASPEARQIRQ
ncbi:hypothetical protein SAPIO_CDS1837 [Scedosporium apiospermum]|uniref:Uncharacterized protein n=1 Tax=Pseudallescheria apiosperma TaxID=563466 RepID=A0A084GDV1_PSEDA|nr:uncharacterized protein SAPIO_CDS1837 [Scedosporium apiospermum]KEZ45513.1 hypothetical protein SAPIO_CDS1837 [Scedosporium apiospermum]